MVKKFAVALSVTTCLVNVDLVYAKESMSLITEAKEGTHPLQRRGLVLKGTEEKPLKNEGIILRPQPLSSFLQHNVRSILINNDGNNSFSIRRNTLGMSVLSPRDGALSLSQARGTLGTFSRLVPLGVNNASLLTVSPLTRGLTSIANQGTLTLESRGLQRNLNLGPSPLNSPHSSLNRSQPLLSQPLSIFTGAGLQKPLHSLMSPLIRPLGQTAVASSPIRISPPLKSTTVFVPESKAPLIKPVKVPTLLQEASRSFSPVVERLASLVSPSVLPQNTTPVMSTISSAKEREQDQLSTPILSEIPSVKEVFVDHEEDSSLESPLQDAVPISYSSELVPPSEIFSQSKENKSNSLLDEDSSLIADLSQSMFAALNSEEPLKAFLGEERASTVPQEGEKDLFSSIPLKSELVVDTTEKNEQSGDLEFASDSLPLSSQLIADTIMPEEQPQTLNLVSDELGTQKPVDKQTTLEERPQLLDLVSDELVTPKPVDKPITLEEHLQTLDLVSDESVTPKPVDKTITTEERLQTLDFGSDDSLTLKPIVITTTLEEHPQTLDFVSDELVTPKPVDKSITLEEHPQTLDLVSDELVTPKPVDKTITTEERLQTLDFVSDDSLTLKPIVITTTLEEHPQTLDLVSDELVTSKPVDKPITLEEQLQTLDLVSDESVTPKSVDKPIKLEEQPQLLDLVSDDSLTPKPVDKVTTLEEEFVGFTVVGDDSLTSKPVDNTPPVIEETLEDLAQQLDFIIVGGPLKPVPPITHTIIQDYNPNASQQSNPPTPLVQQTPSQTTTRGGLLGWGWTVGGYGF